MSNKRIQLCGLGNGLVDLLYQVEFEELERFGLRKGEMRLVSPAEQQELLQSLDSRPHVRCRVEAVLPIPS